MMSRALMELGVTAATAGFGAAANGTSKAGKLGKLLEALDKIIPNGGSRLLKGDRFLPDDTGLTLRMQFEDGMDLRAFNRKIEALRRNVAQRQAVSNIPHGVSDAARRNLTRQHRRILARRIESFYANNPAARESALARLRASDIDHILDLQLSGQNVRSNLKTLHSFTNQRLGSQISGQLPVGQAVPITGVEVFY